MNENETNHYVSRNCTVNGFIKSYIHALDNSLTMAKYYDETNSTKYLMDSSMWLDVANIYLREINNQIQQP